MRRRSARQSSSAGELSRQAAALQSASCRGPRQRTSQRIGAPLQWLPPNYLLQRTPETSYVSINHCGSAPLNTASDGIVVAVGIASAFDQSGLYERALSRPACRIGEGN